jgi:predicted nuclease of predicted toxin-antitoxin system
MREEDDPGTHGREDNLTAAADAEVVAVASTDAGVVAGKTSDAGDLAAEAADVGSRGHRRRRRPSLLRRRGS